MGIQLLPLLPPLPVPVVVLALAFWALLLVLHFGLGRKGLRLRLALYPEPALQLLNVRVPPWLLRRLNGGLRGGLPLQVERLVAPRGDDERQVDLRLLARRQLALDLLGDVLEPLQRHLVAPQVHPVPAADTKLNPVGNVSVTVMLPVVSPVPPLVTVST